MWGGGGVRGCDCTCVRVCVRSFTKDLAPQGEAFTRDLKFEKKNQKPRYSPALRLPGIQIAGTLGFKAQNIISSLNKTVGQVCAFLGAHCIKIIICKSIQQKMRNRVIVL